jgi:hypothetical protein
MRAFGYNLNRGHSLFGGYGWILTDDTETWFCFIPFPILEAGAVILFVITFGVAMQIMWVHP